MNDGALERPWSGQHAWDRRAGGGGAESCNSPSFDSLFPWPPARNPIFTTAAISLPDPEHTT